MLAWCTNISSPGLCRQRKCSQHLYWGFQQHMYCKCQFCFMVRDKYPVRRDSGRPVGYSCPCDGSLTFIEILTDSALCVYKFNKRRKKRHSWMNVSPLSAFSNRTNLSCPDLGVRAQVDYWRSWMCPMWLGVLGHFNQRRVHVHVSIFKGKVSFRCTELAAPKRSGQGIHHHSYLAWCTWLVNLLWSAVLFA